MKFFFLALVIIGVFVIGFTIFNSTVPTPEPIQTAHDYKDVTYIINGQPITLTDGFAQTESTSDATQQITTEYFEKELKTDINGDGREDVTFILTQKVGDSRPLFYAVAAVNTKDGYIGSQGYLLGDSTTPLSIEMSDKLSHKDKDVIVFHYVDWTLGEPIDQSVYLKFVPETMVWRIVEEDIAQPANAIPDLIEITNPQTGVEVDSPIEVSGSARGTWFFEATAPVVVTNWDGLIIGEGYIEAQEDWMTEEFVPFAGEITYQLEPNTYSATGTVIFKRSNPSGLPENDQALEVTVQLADSTK
jgi:hypothetical protein